MGVVLYIFIEELKWMKNEFVKKKLEGLVNYKIL